MTIRPPEWVRWAYDRWTAFWRNYNGSLLLTALLVISFVMARQVDQIKRTAAEGRATAAALAREREERLRAIVEQQTALAQYAAQLALLQLQAVRQANLDGCMRDNRTRHALRGSVSAQIEVIKGIEQDTVARLPLRDYIAVMRAQERALAVLEPVNCGRLYPPVVVTTTGE